MARGERAGSSPAHTFEVDRAIRNAEVASRYEFSVFVGNTEDEPPRQFADRLHESLVAPARSVLIVVDPTRRVIEVITGEEVRRTLSNGEVELAMGQMREYFANGDLTDGLVRGINMLGEHARAPRTLHAG